MPSLTPEALYKASKAGFGPAWCGPKEFKHGEETLVATYTGEGDGQSVNVYCKAMPATFYTLIVRPGKDSVGGDLPGYVITTGSGMGQWAADTARAIAYGMLGFKPSLISFKPSLQ